MRLFISEMSSLTYLQLTSHWDKLFIIMINRVLSLPLGQSLFLWGAKKTGKTTYLKERFPESPVINLAGEGFLKYSKNPSCLREELLLLSCNHPIIIEEIQAIPEILDEVHWMIEQGLSFILCGSNFRKLKKGNLLGGRAWRQIFLPLCYPELPTFDLLKIFNHGLIPSHYFSEDPVPLLRDYVSKEIESDIRLVGAFNRFLDSMAHRNGEMLNYSSIARECMVNVGTIQLYVEILIDLFLGWVIFPYTKTNSRQLITNAPKFYFFDTGIVTFLREQKIRTLKGAEDHLKHYIFLELMAYKEINKKRYSVQYWRTKTGLEVDFVLAKGRIALNVLTSKSDLRGLIAFTKEHRPAYAAVICLEPQERFIKIGDQTIHIVPVEAFLKNLWAGEGAFSKIIKQLMSEGVS